ncbi:MAG: 50S ribosomal protein L21 [Patescibacteria group bacterium]
MQAIIRHSGKQQLINEGDTIQVSLTKDEEFKPEILAVLDQEKIIFGTPVLSDAKIKADFVKHGKSPKIYVYKFKSKSNYRRKTGHRDIISFFKINSIKYEK